MVNTKETHENLINKLKDHEEADLYMSSVLEKCKNLDRSEADKLLHEALKNLAEARPEDVGINVNENSFKLSALLRLLHFISKKLT
jgi:hypothetical protein